MLTLKFRETSNWRTMIAVEKKVEKGASEGARETAEAIVADIQSSWSGSSPSAYGTAPAYLTGVLDSSVVVEDQGRDEGGRFASKDAELFYITVNTADNDDRGQNYAMALEDPEYLNRPFLAPALKRAEGYFTSNIRRFTRL